MCFVYCFKVHVSGLVSLPKMSNTPARRGGLKVPSYHLTSPETIKFIKEADARQKEKEQKVQETEKIKKEARQAAQKEKEWKPACSECGQAGSKSKALKL